MPDLEKDLEIRENWIKAKPLESEREEFKGRGLDEAEQISFARYYHQAKEDEKMHTRQSGEGAGQEVEPPTE